MWQFCRLASLQETLAAKERELTETSHRSIMEHSAKDAHHASKVPITFPGNVSGQVLPALFARCQGRDPPQGRLAMLENGAMQCSLHDTDMCMAGGGCRRQSGRRCGQLWRPKSSHRVATCPAPPHRVQHRESIPIMPLGWGQAFTTPPNTAAKNGAHLSFQHLQGSWVSRV